MIKRLALLVVSALFANPALSYAAPLDFNEDSESDLTTVVIDDDSALEWHASGETLDTVGENGDHVAIGRWRSPEESLIGYISRLDNALIWNLRDNSTTQSVTFGNATDTAISGGDYNGDGITDAAVVTGGSTLSWRISTDLFSAETPSSTTMTHGRRNDLPMFINIDGTGDLPAVLQRPGVGNISLRTKNPGTSAVRQFRRIPRSLRNFGRPIPIQQPDGTDALLFVRKGSGSTIARIVRLNGRLIQRYEFNEAVDVVVGDYRSEYAGEEFVFAGSNHWRIINPFEESHTFVVAPEGIAVDEININQFTDEEEDDPDYSGLPAPRDTCYEQDPTDGYKIRFIWKPQSDTQFGSVVILPGTYVNKIRAVKTTRTNGDVIRTISFKGNANPDISGLRPHYIDRTMEGATYQQQYGAIVVRVDLINGACLTYPIATPARRID